jgi:hypothetical protein
MGFLDRIKGWLSPAGADAAPATSGAATPPAPAGETEHQTTAEQPFDKASQEP